MKLVMISDSTAVNPEYVVAVSFKSIWDNGEEKKGVVVTCRENQQYFVWGRTHSQEHLRAHIIEELTK